MLTRSNHISFNALLGALALCCVLAVLPVGSGALVPGSLGAQDAQAALRWPTPPRCVDSQWVRDQGRLGLYSKASEYVKRRTYGGGTELRYIWVFYVEVPMYPFGMVPGGRAERHCGTRWVPGTA